MQMELNRISNLPDEVTAEILSRLPLKEAVRTSILSTEWRHKWDSVPSLVFDDTCVSAQTHPTRTFANIVDHVLLLHTGPLYKFKLSRRVELATGDMDRWILHVCRKRVIKAMIIDVWQGDPYNIPSSLFSCQDIVYLELFRCLLKPLSACQGFRSLNNLDIQKVTMTQVVFENLIGGSPLLEILRIKNCEGFTNLKIDAPKLWDLDVAGDFEDINLDNTSNLNHVAILLTGNDHQRRNSGSSGNLVKFLYHHPHIGRLTMNTNFLKYLSTGAFPDKVPKCQYLTYISVKSSFYNPDEITTVLCLLRSCPVLQALEIGVEESEEVDAAVGEVESSLYDNHNWTCTQLRVVKLTKLSCVKAQLDLIKFLLLNSPVLERMTVQPASVDVVSKLVKDLLKFKRDSKHAEIILLDP